MLSACFACFKSWLLLKLFNPALILYACFQLWQYGFELIFVKNNHEFVHENMKKPENVELMRRLGALGDGNQDLSKCLLCIFLLFFFESGA